MSENAAVVFVNNTRHVLSALTRTDETSQDISRDQLVGNSFELRRILTTPTDLASGLDFEIQAEELDVANVENKSGLMANPRGFTLAGEPGQFALDPINIGPGGDLTAVALKSNELHLQLSLAIAERLQVWVQIQKDNFSIVGQGDFDPDGTVPANGKAIWDVGLNVGAEYELLVLVEKHYPKAAKLTVSP